MCLASVQNFFDFDLRCLCQAKRQLISMDLQLHRVPHRRKLHHGHLRPRNNAHIKKMLAQRPRAPDLANHRAFPDLQLL